MKKMTKKEFTRETMSVIENLNFKDLERVRKGIYILYRELSERGCIKFGQLNELQQYLLDIGSQAATEYMLRTGIIVDEK